MGVFLGVACEDVRTYQLRELLFLVHNFFVLDCFIPGAEGKADGVTFLLVVCSIRMREYPNESLKQSLGHGAQC